MAEQGFIKKNSSERIYEARFFMKFSLPGGLRIGLNVGRFDKVVTFDFDDQPRINFLWQKKIRGISLEGMLQIPCKNFKADNSYYVIYAIKSHL